MVAPEGAAPAPLPVSDAPVRDEPPAAEIAVPLAPTVAVARQALAELAAEAALDEPLARARALATPEAVFDFVRDEVATEAYRGQLRGPAGTLANRAGNDIDKGLLLIAMISELGGRADLCRAEDAPALRTSRRIGEPEAFAMANGVELDGWWSALSGAMGPLPESSTEPGPRWRVRLEVDGIARVVDVTESSATFRGGQLDGCAVMSLPPDEVHRVTVVERCGSVEAGRRERPASELFGSPVGVARDCGADELSVEVVVDSPGRERATVGRRVPRPESELLVVVGVGPHDGRARVRGEAVQVAAVVQQLDDDAAPVDEALRDRWSALSPLTDGLADPRAGLAPLALLDRVVRTGDIFGRPVVVDGPNVTFVAVGVDRARYANAPIGTYALDVPVRRLAPTDASPADRMRVGSAGMFVAFDAVADANGRASAGEAHGRLGLDVTGTGAILSRARAEGRTWLPVDANEVDRLFANADARAEARAALAGGSSVVAPEGLSDLFGGDAFVAVAKTGEVTERRFSGPGGALDASLAAACAPVSAQTVDQAARVGACSAEEPRLALGCEVAALAAETAIAASARACNEVLGIKDVGSDGFLPKR